MRENCTDRVDNDGDGLVDCADSTCASTAACSVRTDAGPDRVDAPYIPVDAWAPDSGLLNDCGALDVVFVIDVSTSMGPAIGALRSGIRDVWDAASRLSPDARFSLIVFVDDALAVDGCAPFGSVDTLSTAFDYWQSFCASNESPVSHAQNYDFPENSLDALQLAARSCSFRPGATRIVVHVTDDTFLERPMVFSDVVPAQSTFAEVSTSYVANELRFASFHGDEAYLPNGYAAPYNGAPSLVEVTHGASFSLPAVVRGELNMGEAIRAFIEAEYCTDFIL